MSELSKKKCVACSADVPPLKGDAFIPYKTQLAEGWNIVDEHHLEKEYRFKNFKEALAFTCALGKIAEEEGHHPTITLTWGKVTVKLFTHKIHGLSENDFILAAKCDTIVLG